jgi:hypothetical protein
MHPAQLLTIKQRVLTTEVAAAKPFIDRMRRTDDPARLAFQLAKLNQ